VVNNERMMMLKPFLDMDGVITNFSHNSFQAFGKVYKEEDYPLGLRDHEAIGVSIGEFWRVVNAGGAEFWSSMPKFPWTDALIKGLKGFTICTSPSQSAHCVQGKRQWMIANGIKGTNYAIIKDKHLIARPDRVLIDDTAKKVNAWRNEGGVAILFPQPWNDNHHIKDRLAYVWSEMARLESKRS
jgi:hypothetical protein